MLSISFHSQMTGIPILYYGSEQGFAGANDPYNREPLWISNYDETSEYYLLIQKMLAARFSYPRVSFWFLMCVLGSSIKLLVCRSYRTTLMINFTLFHEEMQRLLLWRMQVLQKIIEDNYSCKFRKRWWGGDSDDYLPHVFEWCETLQPVPLSFIRFFFTFSFWNDCLTVEKGQFTVHLLHGESKVYFPVTSAP